MLDSFKELSLKTKILLSWFAFDVILSILIAATTNDFSLAIYLFLWIIISVIAYKLRPPFFIASAFVLAVLEETIVYYLGGGLQGTATSLLDDFAGSLPVFLAIIVGWWFVLKRYYYSEESLYLFSGLHGFFMEIIVPGLIFNPVSVILFGGSSIFVYATIIVCPQRPKAKTDLKETNTLMKVILWFLIIILMVIGGIIGDTLRKILV